MVPVIPPTCHCMVYSWSCCQHLPATQPARLSLATGRMASQANILLLQSAHVNVAWSGLVGMYFRMGGLVCVVE